MVWLCCRVFNHHSWVLIERYEPKVKAQIFTGEGFEEKFIPNPFISNNIEGKWKCVKCGRVSIGTRRNAYQ